MAKTKCCKGTGLAIGFGCGEPLSFFEKSNGLKVFHSEKGLCKKKCYPHWLLNSDNGKVFMQKAILKVQKPRKELEAREVSEKAERSLKGTLNYVKTRVHKYIRERDKGKPCISCDTPYSSDFEAGHFYSAASFLTLKFNLDNINGQCVQCNKYKGGNFEQYSLRLPNRIGQQRYNELVKLAEIDKQFDKVWTIEKLNEVLENLKSRPTEN